MELSCSWRKIDGTVLLDESGARSTNKIRFQLARLDMAKTKTGRRFRLREKPATRSGRRCIEAIGQTTQPHSPLKQRLRGHCVAGLTIGSALFASSSAIAACSSAAPASGQTVTCDTAPPNPTSTNIQAAPGSSNVIVNIEPNSSLSIARTTSPVAVGVDTESQINNAGTISLTGGGGTGGNRGAAMLGVNNNNTLTNSASGVIDTTGAFNDGMAANGSSNTLINDGTITTAGPNAYGMTASWGQTNVGQSNNTIVNNGSVTTNGSNARAASILGQNGTVTNTGTLLTNGARSTAVYMQGNNDHLINSVRSMRPAAARRVHFRIPQAPVSSRRSTTWSAVRSSAIKARPFAP